MQRDLEVIWPENRMLLGQAFVLYRDRQAYLQSETTFETLLKKKFVLLLRAVSGLRIKNSY